MADTFYVFQVKVAGDKQPTTNSDHVGGSTAHVARGGLAEEVRAAVYRKHSSNVVSSDVTIVDAFVDNAETTISES